MTRQEDSLMVPVEPAEREETALMTLATARTVIK